MHTNGLYLEFTINPCDIDEQDHPQWEVFTFTGNENLSEPFCFHIDLFSANKHIDTTQLIDRRANLIIYQDGQEQRVWNGIIAQAAPGNVGVHQRRYRITLRPALWRLSLTQHCRTFQNQSVTDIIKTVFKDNVLIDFTFFLQKPLLQRAQCVQYNESDLAFVQRLLAEEGIHYYFVHQRYFHTLRLVSHILLPSSTTEHPVTYLSRTAGKLTEPVIQNLSQHTNLAITHIKSGDYFPETTQEFLHDVYANEHSYQGWDLTHYYHGDRYHNDTQSRDNVGGYHSDECGKALAKIRLQSLRQIAHGGRARSNHLSLKLGYRVELENGPSQYHDEVNSDMGGLLTRMRHSARQPAAAYNAPNGLPSHYATYFQQTPAIIQHRPPLIKKPAMGGIDTARITGPGEETLFCDNLFRVRLHFIWDSNSQEDENSSPWIRVAQNWAGHGYGTLALPRAGMEVTVTYLDGDPDRPMVTGCLYNGSNRPPYALPEHKAKTVFRTASIQGNGYNEISFDDVAGQENFFMHAQKDRYNHINNNQYRVTLNDAHLTIDNNQYTRITGNCHHQIDQSQYQRIEGNRYQKNHKIEQQIIQGNTLITAKGTFTAHAQGPIHLQAGNRLIFSNHSLQTQISSAGLPITAPQIHYKKQSAAPQSNTTLSSDLPIQPDTLTAPHVPNPEKTLEQKQREQKKQKKQKKPTPTSPHKPIEANQSIYVEIIGTGHSDQQVVLQEQRVGWNTKKDIQVVAGYQAHSEYEERPEKAHLQSQSRIMHWQSTRAPRLSNWLNLCIHCPDADDIVLPIFTHLGALPYQEDGTPQEHQIQVIYPLLALPGALNDDEKIQAHPQEKNPIAPMRPGFLYIFYQGQAWRELQVKQDDDGIMRFYDSHLAQHRNETGQFIAQRRPIVGAGLDDIFVPGKYQGQDYTQKVRLFYSPVALHGARLNHLETYPDVLNALSQPLTLESASNLPPMRPRNESQELTLSHPDYLNQDLSGEAISALKNRLQTQIRQQRTSETSATEPRPVEQTPQALRNEQKTHQCAAHSFALQDWALSTLCDETPIEDPLVVTRTYDALVDAKARHLNVTPLKDPWYALRHDTHQLTQAIAYLHRIQADINAQPFSDSAQLLEAVALPFLIGHKKNLLAEQTQDLNKKPNATLATTLRWALRKPTTEAIHALQQRLFATLQSDALLQTVNHFTSGEDINALAPVKLISYAIHHLALEPEYYDPLNKESATLESQVEAQYRYYCDNVLAFKKAIFPFFFLFSFPNIEYTLKQQYLVFIDLKEQAKNRVQNTFIPWLTHCPPLLDSLILTTESAKEQLRTIEPELIRQNPNPGDGRCTPDAIIRQSAPYKLLFHRNTTDPFAMLMAQDNSDQTLPEIMAHVAHSSAAYPIARRLSGHISEVVQVWISTGALIRQWDHKHNTKDTSERFILGAAARQKISDTDIAYDINYQKVHIDPMTQELQAPSGHVLLLPAAGKPPAQATIDPNNRLPEVKTPSDPLDIEALTTPEGSKLHQALQEHHTQVQQPIEAAQNQAARINTNRAQGKAAPPESYTPAPTKIKLTLPSAFILLEIYNLEQATEYLFQNFKHDRWFGVANLLSAGLDMSVLVSQANAILNPANRWAELGRKVAIDFSESPFTKKVGPLVVGLVEKVRVLSAISGVAGVLTAGLAFTQMQRAWAKDYKGEALGQALIGTGALIGSLNVLFETAWVGTAAAEAMTAGAVVGSEVAIAAALFNPISLVAMALCISGYFIVAQFSKTDVEQWIERSPFAKEPPTEKPEADSLYNELVNFIIHPRITLQEVSHEYSELHNGLTHYARIESNIFGVENLLNLKIAWQAQERLFQRTITVQNWVALNKALFLTHDQLIYGQNLYIIKPNSPHNPLKNTTGQPVIGLTCRYREQLVGKKPKANFWVLEVRAVIYSNNCRLPVKGYLHATRSAQKMSKDSELFHEVEEPESITEGWSITL